MKPLSLLLMLVMCGPAWADEVSDLIRQLDAENFLEREKAAGRLESLGKKAVPGLEKSATEGALETAVRSIEILKKLMESEDNETAREAKSTLERLAESEHAATARRAKNALDPPKPEPMLPARANPIRIPFGRPLPAPVARANNVRKVQTRFNNGVKTVEVEDGDRKVKIEDDPNKGIRVEITEKKNGREVTKGFEAKTEDDLKKNHPEAHAEYEKYGNGFGLEVRAGGAVPINPAVPARQRFNGMRLQSAGRVLQTLARHMESVIDDNAIKGASNESRETFKKEVSEMKNRLAELEKKLQLAIEEETKPKPAEAAKAQVPENAQPDSN